MTDSHRLERLRRLIALAQPDPDLSHSVSRLETAIARREEERRSLRRQIEHLQGCIDDLETEARVIDTELAGLEKTLEALYEDIADRTGVDIDEWWSPTPVVGFRAWLLKEDGLHGARVRWTSRHLTAGCLGASSDGEVPHIDGECGYPPCGIYATKRTGTLLGYFGNGSLHDLALGMVTLSGRVVDHELGYRAARAEVVALTVVPFRSLTTTSDPVEIDELFVSSREEISARCAPAESPIEEACAYLEERATRYEPWTSASN